MSTKFTIGPILNVSVKKSKGFKGELIIFFKYNDMHTIYNGYKLFAKIMSN